MTYSRRYAAVSFKYAIFTVHLVAWKSKTFRFRLAYVMLMLVGLFFSEQNDAICHYVTGEAVTLNANAVAFGTPE